MKGSSALLIIVLVALGVSIYLSYNNYEQIQLLRQENHTILMKLDSIQQVVNQKPVKQAATSSATPAAKKSTGSALLDFVIQVTEESEKEAAAAKAKQKVTVSSKYRLEDRYVKYGGVCTPELLGNQVGEVVLNIRVDYSGEVKSAKLQSATGITDEEVIEACKKAALKTKFNYNSDLGYNVDKSGTITYIFTAK